MKSFTRIHPYIAEPYKRTPQTSIHKRIVGMKNCTMQIAATARYGAAAQGPPPSHTYSPTSDRSAAANQYAALRDGGRYGIAFMCSLTVELSGAHADV